MFKLYAEQSSIVHKCNEMSYCFLCITSQEPILLIMVWQHRIQPKINALFFFELLILYPPKMLPKKVSGKNFVAIQNVSLPVGDS